MTPYRPVTMKYKLLLLSLTLSANAVTTVFTNNSVEATDGSADISTNALIQTFSYTGDLDGDSIDDVYTYTITTQSNDPSVDFSPTGTQYTFRTAGGDYTMSFDTVSFVSSNNHIISDLDGTITSFFKSGSGSYTVSNGTDSYTHTDNNNTASTPNISFSTDDTLTWSGNGNSGPRALSFSFTLETEANPIPEPSSVALLGLGGLALLSRRKR